MMSHLREVGMLKCRFKRLEISHISRGNNCHADSLATLNFFSGISLSEDGDG